MTTTMICS